MTIAFRTYARILSIACVALTATLFPKNTRADLVLDLSIAEMTVASSAVVHGRVTHIDTAWNDSHTRIFTEITVSVTNYLSGQGPDVVQIRQAGGRVGERELFIAGQPRFTLDEEVVLFLEPVGSGESNTFVVMCMSAGKFTVTFDQLTGERVVGQDLLGLNALPAQGRRTVRRAPVARPFLFRELVRTISTAQAERGDR